MLRIGTSLVDANSTWKAMDGSIGNGREDGPNELFTPSLDNRAHLYRTEIVRQSHARFSPVANADSLVDADSIQRVVVKAFSIWTSRVVLALDYIWKTPTDASRSQT